MGEASKKRKILDLSPAEQFASLRKVSALTPATCRKVISILQNGSGGRCCARRQHAHAVSYPCLRSLSVPSADEKTSIQLPCMSLPALIEAKVQACPLYKESLRRACQKYQNELTLLCYADDVTGGNVLSAPQARKANIVYLSWLECPLLHLESQWLTASVCRSSDIAAMQGGMAGLLTTLLSFIKDECEHGFPILWEPGDADLIHIKEIYILADAEAIRSASGCKGSAGIKPCLHCLNVCALGKATGAEAHVDISSSDIASFWPQTSDSITEAANLLENARTLSQRKELEKALGWNWENLKAGPLLAPKLKDWLKIENVLYDSMHIFFHNGQISQVLGQWWTMLQNETNITLKELQRYAELWLPVHGSPAACGPKPSRFFIERLWRKDGDFRGDADAAAATLSLVVAFCEEILLSHTSLRPYIESLQCLQKLIGCVWACKVNPSHACELPKLQERHFQSYAKAWSTDTMRPKWHYGLHLETQIRRCGMLLDCFTLERKHKFFQKLTTGNWGFAPSFAESALLELSTADLQEGQAPNWLDAALLGPTALQHFPGLNNPCLTSATLVLHGVKYVKHQYVILTPTCACQVRAAVETADHKFFLFVEMLKPIRELPTYRTRWQRQNNLCALVNSNDLNRNIRVMYYRLEDDQSVSLLT